MDSFLTAPQVAAQIGCSGKQVRRFILSGKLEAHKIGVEYRIEQAEVDRFKASLRVGPQTHQSETKAAS